jgi:hypothetical protein
MADFDLSFLRARGIRMEAKTRPLHKGMKDAAPENSTHPKAWPTRQVARLVSYRIRFRSHKYVLTWQIQYQ